MAVRKNFKLLEYEHIKYEHIYIILALKHIIWRFRICNYFREMFKFRNFMNTLRNFAKSVFACIFAKFTYQLIPSLTIPPGRPPGNFLKGRIPYPPGTKKVNCTKIPPPGQFFSKIQQKYKTSNRNNEKQYWNANMFRNIKTVKHIKA